MAAVKRFGKYVLTERIAVGGMAEVFRGSLSGDAGFERPVAIKRILPQLTEDEDFVSMFIDEAKIAVQLSHGNIAQIIDLGRVDDSYFIAMEYVHGRDLRAILERESARRSAVPLPIACHVVMRVAEALHHAHNASGRDGRPLGVIHRDVSPQNVLISFDGEIKVVDFGLAKAAGRATQTNAGVVKGKLAYLSPQQARGDDIDHRSDIYSLGLVFFELLTGRKMFDQTNDIDTVLAVQSNAIVGLRDVAPRMPPALDEILARALEDDPNARYQTGMDLHDALEVFIYEHAALTTRKDVAEYVRTLFPDAAPPIDPGAGGPRPPMDTVTTEHEPKTKTDTVPVPPQTLEAAEADASAFEDDLTTDGGQDDQHHDTWITQLKPDMTETTDHEIDGDDAEDVDFGDDDVEEL